MWPFATDGLHLACGVNRVSLLHLPHSCWLKLPPAHKCDYPAATWNENAICIMVICGQITLILSLLFSLWWGHKLKSVWHVETLQMSRKSAVCPLFIFYSHYSKILHPFFFYLLSFGSNLFLMEKFNTWTLLSGVTRLTLLMTSVSLSCSYNFTNIQKMIRENFL